MVILDFNEKIYNNIDINIRLKQLKGVGRPKRTQLGYGMKRKEIT